MTDPDPMAQLRASYGIPDRDSPPAVTIHTDRAGGRSRLSRPRRPGLEEGDYVLVGVLDADGSPIDGIGAISIPATLHAEMSRMLGRSMLQVRTCTLEPRADAVPITVPGPDRRPVTVTHRMTGWADRDRVVHFADGTVHIPRHLR